MSDNEEGFATEAASELIDFNYQPSSRAWTTLAKKANCVFKKSSPLTLITCTSKLINDSIHEEWVRSLYSVRRPANLVFAARSHKDLVREQNIKFESEFESGNMEIIERRKVNEYDMYMKPDTNTANHFQWFYFRLSIKRASRVLKFTIKNFIKATMLYSQGLRPYCRSLKNPDYHEFRQIEGEVKFYQDQQTQYFCLEFCFNFEYDDDEVEFCSQPPYTFLHLNKFISTLTCKKLWLGKTVMGTKIPYLLFEAKRETRVVGVAIARQHPGEAVGSWMMEGFVTRLSEDKNNDFVSWYVIPMVNIDGVVVGNNRTGILGHDFNRNWVYDQGCNSKMQKLFPQIQGIITLLKTLKRKFPRKVKMFLDFHGHSSQPNVFTYGPPHEEQSEYFFQSRLFPELVSRKNPNFKLAQCSYVLHPDKKKTARAIVFYNIGVPFTYTIQSTFGVMCGKSSATDDFLKIGQDIAASAFQFLHATVVKESAGTLSTFIEEIKQKYAGEQNEGVEYDSASEASDENPNRKQIEEMIIADDLPEAKFQYEKQSHRYEDQKVLGVSLEKQPKSLIKPVITHSRQIRNLSLQKKGESKRVSTEGELILNRRQCLLPSIATRNSKLSFDQVDNTSSQEIMQNLKIDYIQKRLQKLRNSKIGKKILVINAYCS